jgi:hypothetical protein
MAFTDLLINTCTVQRWASLVSDDYGQPVKTWNDYLVDQKCRLSYPKGRQVQRDTEVIPVEAVLFLENIDVTEYDRVIVDGITYEILFVATLQGGSGNHHKELSLRRVIP